MGTLRKALFWSTIERLGFQGSSFLLTIFLARLLSPREYGLIGMLTIFCNIGYVVADSGFTAALVQRQANSADDEATVFYVNIGAGAVLTLLICAVSPLVARFYRQPILVPLLCVLSLQVFLSSFGIVQFALLQRAMDFRRQAIVGILSVVLSGLVGVGMALSGLGVWSLGNWRLTGRFRRASFQAMWSFSSRLLASSLLNAVFENLYNIVIGRVY